MGPLTPCTISICRDSATGCKRASCKESESPVGLGLRLAVGSRAGGSPRATSVFLVSHRKKERPSTHAVLAMSCGRRRRPARRPARHRWARTCSHNGKSRRLSCLKRKWTVEPVPQLGWSRSPRFSRRLSGVGKRARFWRKAGCLIDKVVLTPDRRTVRPGMTSCKRCPVSSKKVRVEPFGA